MFQKQLQKLPIKTNKNTDNPKTNALYHSVKQLMNNGDIKIILKNKNIQAHSTFMKRDSIVFKTMLEINMKENHDNEIDLSCFSTNNVIKIMEWIHLRKEYKFEVSKENEWLEALKICKVYEIKQLETCLERGIYRRISLYTTHNLFKLTCMEGELFENIQDKCFEWILLGTKICTDILRNKITLDTFEKGGIISAFKGSHTNIILSSVETFLSKNVDIPKNLKIKLHNYIMDHILYEGKIRDYQHFTTL